jgi:hypothetical protein
MNHIYQNIQGWFSFPSFYSNLVSEAKDGYHFVEVGTWKGCSAAYMAVEIINSKKQIKFDCVDTWSGSEETIDPQSVHYEPLLLEKDGLYNLFINNIEPVKHVIKPVRKASLEALDLYENGSLDCVFIDAAHDYENVCKDIQGWLPKIKPGGILSGHDWDCKDVQQALVDTLKDNYQPIGENVWIYKVKKLK